MALRRFENDRAYLKEVAEHGVYEYVQARIAGRVNRADAYHARAMELLDEAPFRDVAAAAAREDLAADRMRGVNGAQGPMEPPPEPPDPQEQREFFRSVMLGELRRSPEGEDEPDSDDGADLDGGAPPRDE